MKTLIIVDENNQIRECGKINEKGYRKSIENSELWYVHDETERLLPWEKGSLVSIFDKENWIEAHVKIEGSAEGSSKPGLSNNTDNDNSLNESVLLDLQDVIRQRKKDMPEGSYTTHLFEKGSEKIRKKTGEEAIELILARDKDETVYEMADFLYHSLVLLVNENIDIREVLSELKRR